MHSESIQTSLHVSHFNMQQPYAQIVSTLFFPLIDLYSVPTVNSTDWVWYTSEQKQSYDVEGIAYRAHRQNYVEVLKVSESTICKRKNTGCPEKLSGEESVCNEGDKESDSHSGWALEILCGDGRIFQEEKYHCDTPPICTQLETHKSLGCKKGSFRQGFLV